MLQQILNNPDKDFAKAACSPEARQRLGDHLRRSRIWSAWGFFIWSLLMAASASSLAAKIRSPQDAPEAQATGLLRTSFLMFGLTVIGASAAVSRWHTCNTELKLLDAVDGIAALANTPVPEKAGS